MCGKKAEQYLTTAKRLSVYKAAKTNTLDAGKTAQ